MDNESKSKSRSGSRSRPKDTSTNVKKNENDSGLKAEKQNIPRGKPKSGRLWKTVRSERHSSIKKVKRFKTSWAEKMEKKKDKDHFKETKKRMQEDRTNEKRLKRQRTEENKKRKTENQKKAEVVQVIKDTSKIKRMRKKHLRTIETR